MENEHRIISVERRLSRLTTILKAALVGVLVVAVGGAGAYAIIRHRQAEERKVAEAYRAKCQEAERIQRETREEEEAEAERKRQLTEAYKAVDERAEREFQNWFQEGARAMWEQEHGSH